MRACVLQGGRQRTPSTIKALGTGWLHSWLYSDPLNLFAGTGWDREQKQFAKPCTQSSAVQFPPIVRLNAGGKGSALLKCGEGKEAQYGEQRAPRAKGSRAVCFVGVPFRPCQTSNGDPAVHRRAIPPTLLSRSDPCWSEKNSSQRQGGFRMSTG